MKRCNLWFTVYFLQNINQSFIAQKGRSFKIAKSICIFARYKGKTICFVSYKNQERKVFYFVWIAPKNLIFSGSALQPDGSMNISKKLLFVLGILAVSTWSALNAFNARNFTESRALRFLLHAEQMLNQAKGKKLSFILLFRELY